MTRIAELATQARSPAYDGFSRKAILTEVTSLKETLVDLANTKDSYGQSLFSGFRTDKEALFEILMALFLITVIGELIQSKFLKM